MLTSVVNIPKITEVKKPKFYSTDVNIPKITEVKPAKFYSTNVNIPRITEVKPAKFYSTEGTLVISSLCNWMYIISR
jgi:hypothetical protein